MPFALACALAASLPTLAAIPLEQLHGRGASVPFVEHEAESACFQGQLVGPSRRYTELASEASGRRAVILAKHGDYVEFTLGQPANALTLRYAIPDSSNGAGRDSTLSVTGPGGRLGTLAVTSRFGWFYGKYPFTNRPADGNPHHFFDEARLLLDRTLPAGSTVRIAIGKGDEAPWYAIDLADFELVGPPAPAPANAIPIDSFGADPTGRSDSSAGLRAAIRAAQRSGGTVWIGPGNYRIAGHILVDKVTIQGAGPWHSVLHGNGAGFYGKASGGGSTAVHLDGFTLSGDVRERIDRAHLSGIGGRIGGGSTITNLWLQHHKTGIWIDGPADGLVIGRLRILDNTADGINLRGGVRHAVVENNFVRNSGDDGIALWSQHQADSEVTIRNNTVVAPILANGIAIYGGHDIQVSSNLVADTVTQGGGIHLGQRFGATPFAGRITLTDNLLVRSGSFDPNWRFGIGALWFYALDRAIDADIRLNRTEMIDSTLPAIQFIGEPIRTVAFNGLRIRGARHVLQVQSAGAASLANIAIDRVVAGIATCRTGFELRPLENATPLTKLPDLPCAAISAGAPD